MSNNKKHFLFFSPFFKFSCNPTVLDMLDSNFKAPSIISPQRLYKLQKTKHNCTKEKKTASVINYYLKILKVLLKTCWPILLYTYQLSRILSFLLNSTKRIMTAFKLKLEHLCPVHKNTKMILYTRKRLSKKLLSHFNKKYRISPQHLASF